MRDYPNVITKALEKNESLSFEMKNAALRVFNAQKDIALEDDKFVAKLFTDNIKTRFLMVKNLKKNRINIYQEQVSSKESAFSYELKNLKKGETIYGDKVFSFIEDKNTPIEPKFKFDDVPEDLKEMIAKLNSQLAEIEDLQSGDTDFFATSSIYDLKKLANFLGVSREESVWIGLGDELNGLVQNKIEKHLININFIFDVVEKHKFTAKNKFTFNDLDNNLWKQGQGFIMESQNLGFYCIQKNAEITIYAYDRNYGGSSKSTSSISGLIKNIKENPDDLIGNVAIKIKDGTVTFVDNALIYALERELHYTTESLIDDNLGEPEYPVDVRSYEYQLSYYQKRWGYENEFSFLNQALLTLGSGFSYDRESGRFFCGSVEYDPTAVDFKPEEKDFKAEHIYGCPKEFTHLDPSWEAAVGRLVDVLKRDRPLPIIVDTKEEKERELDKIIMLYEGGLEALKQRRKIRNAI